VGIKTTLTVYAILAFGYSLLMPMWEAPDEQAHYGLVLHIARQGELPPPQLNHEAWQPPLYYWLMSWPLRLLDAIDSGLADAYQPPRRPRGLLPVFIWNDENYRFLIGPQLLRWLNLLIGGVTLHFIYRGARRFAPDASAVPLTAIALAGTIPQFLHNSASVTNDSSGNLSGAILFWLLARLCTGSVSRYEIASIAASAVLLPSITKLTVLPMALAVGAALAWRVLRDRRRTEYRYLLWGLLLGGAALGIYLVLVPYAADNLFGAFSKRVLHVRPDALNDWPTAALHLLWSFWGVVGMLMMGLPDASMWVMTSFALAGVAAYTSLLLPGSARAPTTGQRTGWVLLFLALGLALLAVTRNVLMGPGTQGRFLFPTLGPISVIVATGWWVLLPEGASRRLPHLTLAVMAALNVHFWIEEIIPFYYQPFLG
jgi:hypothetical protein